MADVVVLGSYNLDLVAIVPRFPAPGETLHADSLLRGHGGKGSNQAVAAARAGAHVAFAGCIGDDDAGRAALDLWRAEEVVALIATRPGLPTGLALILVGPDGENEIVVVAGANAVVGEDDAVRAAGALRAGAVAVAQLETPEPASRALFAAARARGAITVLNTAPARAGVMPELLAATDILIANEGEAALLCGAGADTPPTTFGPQIAAMAGKAAIITCGADGARLFTRDGAALHQPAAEVAVVDTTGAGDCFVGAFAATLSRGGSTAEALAIGVAAGSLACTRAGAVGALPDAASIAAMRATLAAPRAG